MGRWAHGGNIASYQEKYPHKSEILDFSANISPLGLPQGVEEVLVSGVKSVEHYPDPEVRGLRKALGAYHHIGEEHILCGNGASDLIYRLALGKRPKKALLLAPTFSEYEESLSLVSCEIVYHYLEEAKGFTLGEEYLLALEDGIDFCVICQPNNPTGQVVSKGLMLRILQRTQELGIFLLLDECFVDFLSEEALYSCMDVVLDYPHVLILKAFTKMYALAGLRLGYGVCGDVALLEEMKRWGQPWGVSSLAELAGMACLNQGDYVSLVKEEIERERVFLQEGLLSLGYRVYPSLVNYLLFRTEDVLLHLYCEEEGVLIRCCGNYQGLGDGFYRVAVRSRGENLRLLEVLKRR